MSEQDFIKFQKSTYVQNACEVARMAYSGVGGGRMLWLPSDQQEGCSDLSRTDVDMGVILRR